MRIETKQTIVDEEHAELVTLGSCHAGRSDVLDDLMHIEKVAWGVGGAHIEASREKIARRIISNPAGVTVAGFALEIAGCGTVLEAAGSQYAFRFEWDEDVSRLASWDEYTALGWTDKVHLPSAKTGFLVGVGVLPQFRQKRFAHGERWPKPMRISELLIARTLDNLFAAGVVRVIANARIPHYHRMPHLSVDEYCTLRSEHGELFDPVLRFHERMGATVLKPVAYSMEDIESKNAGCWVIYRQPYVG